MKGWAIPRVRDLIPAGQATVSGSAPSNSAHRLARSGPVLTYAITYADSILNP